MLEKDNRVLNERLEISQKTNSQEHHALEKRLEKAIDNERRLQDELDKVKEERDQKILDMQRGMDKERDNFKSKLKDVESKGTIGSVRQTELILNFEKERA